MMTSEQMYLQIEEMHAQEEGNDRSLEDYLCALYGLAIQHRHLSEIPVELLLRFMREAFHVEPLPYHLKWADSFSVDTSELSDFDVFAHSIQRQIVELREMAESGTLDHQFRYFGIKSPRGNNWYNFDPKSIVMCAMQGCFHCWPISGTPEEGVKFSTFSWGWLAWFFEVGQVYE